MQVSQPGFFTYYDILGVDRDARHEELKKAYLHRFMELNKMYFQDSDSCVLEDLYYGSHPQKSKAYFSALLQRAYAVLKDPARRQQYDDFLSAQSRLRFNYSWSTPQNSPIPLATIAERLIASAKRSLSAEGSGTPAPNRATKLLSQQLQTNAPTETTVDTTKSAEETATPTNFYSEKRYYPDGSVEVVEYREIHNLKELPQRVRVLAEQVFSAMR
ncbi:hypothetical protein AGDE_12493 [Angomonas deanei]|uniref:J domain-containing protein n=1 Tax=Angomonas deanei TaxID=59799 RepID=A0A7G2CEG3_9TRYP|nr:hypothetical protein AGDE_12493 [Angomonas deanei]CAD2217073.1 hypothetical protein, conserved [Angomonas deanei]|eukprot:EPY24111.1 hypothetical protein AGDE_12493 [Angomonas deanei]